MKINLEDYLESKKKIVDAALESYLPGVRSVPPTLFESLRYSVFAGGKRLRPILCLASAEAVGGDPGTVLPAACALELIHTYSLIHDDLPAMDDDDYRRGKPTNHKVFGEAVAILAGDALLTEAFHLLSVKEHFKGVPADRILRVIREISQAAGAFGMVGGQVVDIQSEGRVVGEETLYFIHSHKTGALMTASVRSGAILGGATEAQIHSLSQYGRDLGLAFQVADDILNVEGSREVLGKETGSDTRRKKVTFPAVVGLEASRQKTHELVAHAITHLEDFDEKAEPLREIARYMVERKS
jgi:geranylgeranyl diphosphate synthase type II